MGYKTTGSENSSARNELGPILRFFRNRKGLTSDELASRIELENIQFNFVVSADHLNKVERRIKPLTDLLILAYCEALELTFEQLIEEYENGQWKREG